jgi:hypothetical protein
MDELESQNIVSQKKRRRHLGWKILSVLLFLLLISMVGIFLGFNYYGDRILRKYLQEKIQQSSNGLYRADFTKLHVNLLTGKVVLDSFELIPNEAQYQRLKAQGKVARALYSISFSSLTIDKVHFRQIYAGKRINFRQLTVQRPLISIVGFPDTVTARQSKWRVIYEDLYPAVSDFFNDFHIDSVKVNHGFIFTTFGAKTGSQMTGKYEFSTVLRDVSVNPFSYYNKERVFYSRDIDLVVHNFESQLADSLYLLKADEIGFSLTKSVLYGKKVSLLPDFKSKKIGTIRSGDLFRIELPAFSIKGVDLYRAMTDREVEISSVNLTDFFIQVYRTHSSAGTGISKKPKKKISLSGLYTVVAQQLRFIAIDTLRLNNGSFEFYASANNSTPELRIGKVDLELNQFRLDSVSYSDQSRIFYSHAIELDLERISLLLRDGIHSVNAFAINFSTRKSLIQVYLASIFPNAKKNQLQEGNQSNLMRINLPQLLFTGIDLKKVFNRRILDFNRLIINEPEISYTRFRPSKNPDPRFHKPEDFFDADNDDVVYDLLKKYLWMIRGNEIDINRGHIKFSVAQGDSEMPLATSSFDLSMQQFLIDSVHGMNEQGYFYSKDFDLNLQSLSVVSPDSMKHLQADRVHIATRDSLIEADNIQLYKSADPLIFNSRAKRRHPMTFEFSLHKIQLTGLNHKKLFLEKILKANQIVLDNPSLLVKANNSLRPAGPPEESQLLKTNNLVLAFEIGRCLVRNGNFSYNGDGDRKASYFSLKDIDFSLVDATVRLPEPGLHDGLIKFDSLQLKVIPLRAVIADSAYALEARSLEVHSYPANIILQGIKVTPLKSLNGIAGRKSMATITIPEIRFNGFYFEQAIFDNEWRLDGLFVDHPRVEIEMQQDGAGMTNDKLRITNYELRIPSFMKTLAVRNVSVTGANAGLVIHRPDKTLAYSLADVMIDITRFRVDSATQANPAGAPLFNADDITISAPGFKWASPDSLYTYSFARFGISTGTSGAFLDSVAMVPDFSRVDFIGKLKYQTDQITLKIPRITLSDIDLRKLIDDRKLNVRKVYLDKFNLESYRDKRIPFDTLLRPLMPGEMVAKIKFPLSIDTISLTNGFIGYEEQNGNEPGRIFFDRMDATLTGFCTPSYQSTPRPDLNIHLTAGLMGKATLASWLHFETGHPRDTFTMHATIGELDLTTLNPMISKLTNASVKRGIASSTEIVQMQGNNVRTSGSMDFRYQNLAIGLKPDKPGTWNRIEQWLLSSVANLFLARGNPNDDGKIRSGVIYFERDMAKGFPNFVWKSALSGIKSSIGINNKIQREVKRQKKTEK